MQMERKALIRTLIVDVPDFPKPGILFRDITPLLRDPAGFSTAVDLMCEPWRDQRIDCLAAIESRGFIFAAAMAPVLGVGFTLIRKQGKLPRETASVTYELEYGTDTLEAHTDAVEPGQRVLIVDDLLATGGTAAATVQLIREQRGELVGCQFLIELAFLKGADKLGDVQYRALITY